MNLPAPGHELETTISLEAQVMAQAKVHYIKLGELLSYLPHPEIVQETTELDSALGEFVTAHLAEIDEIPTLEQPEAVRQAAAAHIATVVGRKLHHQMFKGYRAQAEQQMDEVMLGKTVRVIPIPYSLRLPDVPPDEWFQGRPYVEGEYLGFDAAAADVMLQSRGVYHAQLWQRDPSRDGRPLVQRAHITRISP